MSYLYLDKKTSRYEVKQSLFMLNSEMLRQLSIFYDYHVPNVPDTACIMVVKWNSIQYLFCDLLEWQEHYNSVVQKEKYEKAVIMVCDVTKGFGDPIQARYCYLRKENDLKDKNFF